MWRSVVVVLLVLMIAQGPLSVGAQEVPGPMLRLEPRPDEAEPNGSVAWEVPVVVRLDCAPPRGFPAALPMDVGVVAEGDRPWVNVSVVPDTVTFERCGPGESMEVVHVAVRLAPDAPGDAEYGVNVSASSDHDHTSASWAAKVPIRMDSTVRFDETEIKAGPNTRLSVPTSIKNHGNAEIVATFKIAQNTSKALNIAPPGPQRVPAGEVLQVGVDIVTPYENGYIERTDLLNIVVIRTSTANGTATEEDVVTASVETVGTYVPGPGAGLVAVALVVLAALARGGTRSKP